MNVTSPIVVDLGTVRKGDIANLRRGAGSIIDDIEEVMRSIRLNLDSGGKGTFLPVVVVFK
jgi:hypothetical protein